MRRVLLALLLWSMARSAHGGEGVALPPTNFELHHVTDEFGRSLTYYLSRPSHPSPLMLMIQGSGCGEALRRVDRGVVIGVAGMLEFARSDDVAVLVVEKPFAGETPGVHQGAARDCSDAFNADFTAERWLVALRAAMADARRQPWIDPRRTLVWGHSEGAVMAALVAGQDPSVTDVVWIAGAATTQLFDQFAQAYDTCFDRSACLAKTERLARAVLAKPDSATDFAWGHPFKRWASFYRVSPVDELLKSRARVYLADGTLDRSVSVMSLELMAARLISADHDVTVRRVANADHALNGPASTTDGEYRRAMAWFRTGAVPPPRPISHNLP